ncbi:MAG: hypothetical protein NT040_11190 [Bacteroidetes bacterium]|nr:hypothetical protein [Bacteroidota bacterium]
MVRRLATWLVIWLNSADLLSRFRTKKPINVNIHKTGVILVSFNL